MAAVTRRTRPASRRVAVIAADAGRLVHLRTPLLRSIAADGHRLLCLTASSTQPDGAALLALGAETAAYDLAGGRPRFFGGARATTDLTQRLADWKPNVVVAIGFEPMLMAAAAARKAGAPRIVLIASSLGGLDLGAGARTALSARWHARRALKAADVLVVYNGEHEQRLRSLDLVPAGLAVHVLPGAGVDLTRYAPTPLPPLHPGLVFTMIAALDRAKGIVDFCEAARRVKVKAPGSRFVLALPRPEGQGDAVAKKGAVLAELRKFADCVEFASAPADARALLAACHVFVYPSHGEGIAHSVLEALACGRPVITSTAPGCREMVDERVSGVLVPPGDVMALAAAMESFLRRPDLIPWMSQAARAKAERRFDANAAAAGLIGLMELDR